MKEKLEKFFEKKWPSRVLGIGILFLVLLAIFPAFRHSGQIVFADLDFGFKLDGYIDRIFPLWNSTWSTSTFFNGTRLPFVLPIYLIVKLFGDYPSILEKLIIFSLIFTSSIGMFFLVFDLLKKEIIAKNYNFPIFIAFIISLGSGIYYSYNPWSIVRIQHIYLLIGYAVLPFIFMELIRLGDNLTGKILNKNILWSVFIASIFYAIGIGAVHYLFFTFFLIFGWYVWEIFFIIKNREYKSIFKLTIRYILFGFLFLGLIAYWLLPYLGASKIASVNPPSINTLDSIIGLARYATFKNALLLQSYWWPMIDLDNLGSLFTIGGFLIIGIIFVGNIFNLKNRIVVFFIFWSLIFVILATGTKTPYFAGMYKWIVFDNPLAGSVGFIFRDSNKLVGLVAFSFAILWGYGISGIINFILTRIKIKKAEIMYLRNVFDKVMEKPKYFFKIGNYKKQLSFRINPYIFLLFSSFFIFVLSYFFYLSPYYNNYFEHFYLPIKAPEDYLNLISFEKKDKSEDKYMYLPRYETLVSPGYEFGVANWNYTSDPQRPTSSFDIYSTVKDTYNPLEGSITTLGYFYEFLDEYLSNSIGNNFDKYLKMLNIGTVVYHSDIHGLEKYQKTQLDNIGRQKLTKEKNIGFNDIYRNNNPNKYATLYKNSIYNLGGLSNLETLFSSKIIDPTSYANIFVSSNTEVNKPDLSNPGDIIIGDNKLDLILSNLTKENLISPFDSNNYSDAFSRWAKNKEDSPDWLYHLKKLEINNFTWDFSQFKGFIFTYAPAMLILEPYEYIHDKGVNVLDFSKVVELGDIFNSSDESNLRLIMEKTSEYSSIPAIKGEVTKGDSKIWKIGSFKPIKAKPKTAYTFEVTISGKNVNSIHGKVKFRDKNGKELGLAYVSAPRYADNFELIKFSGSFITPLETDTINFEINTLQNPTNRSLWWIHDMQLKDLSQYTKANIQTEKFNIKKTGKYKVFVRTFDNIDGGNINITVDNKKFLLNTKTDHINKFLWHEIGNIDFNNIGKKDVLIENVVGFNAVNLISIISEDDFKNLEKMTINAHQLISEEAENSTNFYGNIQSTQNHINLSNGRSVNLNDGNIYYSFDIFKSGNYNLILKTNTNYSTGCMAANGDIVATGKSFVISQILRTCLSDGTFKSENYFGQKINDNNFYGDANITLSKDNKIIKSQKFKMLDNELKINNISLEPGKYSLEIVLKDNNIPIFDINNYQRFTYDDGSLGNTYFLKHDYFLGSDHPEKTSSGKNIVYLEDEHGCSFFQGLEDQFVKIKNLDWTNGKNIKISPGYSCFWFIFSNNPTKIKPETEYLLSYDITKFDAKYLHAKIYFYDKNGKELKNSQIIINGKEILQNQIEGFDSQFDSYKNYHKEYIVKSPKDAYFISVQFWSKQRQDIESGFDLKNIFLKEYSLLPGIDSINIINSSIKKSGEYIPIEYKKDSKMNISIIPPKYSFSGLLVIGESFSPLWQINEKNKYSKPLLTNVFLNGYKVDNIKDVKSIVFLPKKFLVPGFIISILSFLGFFLMFLIKFKGKK